jgi:hypothetical protein
MAQGGYGRGSGIPLRDRVRADASAGPDEPRAPPEAPAPGRHCWISVPVDGHQPRAGLLVEWRRAARDTGVRGGWEGRVYYTAELRPGRWSVVEEWVPEELLSTG